MQKINAIKEFGDYQTPIDLAKIVVNLIVDKNFNFNNVIEPNCGQGNFLTALMESDLKTDKIIGWDINKKYIELVKKKYFRYIENGKIDVKVQDFFKINWDLIGNKYANSTLFIGNPPWVTNSELMSIKSKNVPKKTNISHQIGLDAITGKSNFDISEWMLRKIIDLISGTNSVMAFLVKTSIARKLYSYICNKNLLFSHVAIYAVDMKKHFKINADGCLFFAQGDRKNCINHNYPMYCYCYSSLNSIKYDQKIGYENNHLISNILIYRQFKNIDNGCEFKWRSGIKHDCSKIMELELTKEGLRNGFHDLVHIENTYLFPMYKSSNIAKSNLLEPKKYMLVTQKKIGCETSSIAFLAPKTWKYLEKYAHFLDNRRSSIYKSAPRFSIFGVGDYTFKPWKIVISSLYKNINFTKVGEFQNKSIVLDDTCYMLSFDSEEKADFILFLLNSSVSKNFISSLVFYDNKRIITASLLNRISLKNIAIHLGLKEKYDYYFDCHSNYQYSLNLF